MKRNKLVSYLIFLFMMNMPVSVWSATLNIVDGQLVGAMGVEVEGSLYDVSFADGTCVELFNGCDDSSDFTFNTQSEAFSASNALLEQVFIDGPSGDFNSDPTLTAGIFDTWAYINTNYYVGGSILDGVYAYNDAINSYDFTNIYRTYPLFNSNSLQVRVWAVWDTASTPSAVPIPPSIFLLSTGLIGLAFVRRKKRHI